VTGPRRSARTGASSGGSYERQQREQAERLTHKKPLAVVGGARQAKDYAVWLNKSSADVHDTAERKCNLGRHVAELQREFKCNYR
jgi:hypothetical protein